MFKNLKQRLENLSANSPPGKNATMPTDEGKNDERMESSASDHELLNENAVSKSAVLKSDASHEADQLAQGQNVTNQSERSSHDTSDLMSLTKEELEKTNRVLLGQVKDLEDSKKEVVQKTNRRLGELEEQIQLDRQAKRDLEHSYALMLDEKDELITVLKTQVQLLKTNQPVTMATTSDNQSEELESPISHEEAIVLKEKVKKLECLLSKCKDTIKSNKERSKQLTSEKEELAKINEEAIRNIQSKHEREMNSKMSDMREEIKALTEPSLLQVRAGLNEQLEHLNSQLKEKENSIAMKEKDFTEKMEKVRLEMERLNANLKKDNKAETKALPEASSSKTATTTTSEAGAANNDLSTAATDDSASEQLEKLKELYELRGKELKQVLEESHTLRKEVATQRLKFATVLERYDEQMKVLQGELFERMKPGQMEASLLTEVRLILGNSSPSTDGEEKPEEKDSGKSDEKEKEVERDAGVVKDDAEVKPNMVPRQELELVQGKLERVLFLLEKCAKYIDSRDALENRWKERLVESEERSASQLRVSEETIERLNNQIMELTNRENLLNANLERARQESDAILQQQRTEMTTLQSSVESLLERENQLNSQIQRTKMMCDSEVARVTAENLESVQRLSDTFQETQSTLSDLSRELLESKDHSEMMIVALQSDLDDKCRMLQLTADFIEASNDDALKSTFMKIVLDCSEGQVKASAPVENGDRDLARSSVLPDEAASDKVIPDEISENDNASVENCKSVVATDKREVKIESQNQQELIDFDFPSTEDRLTTNGTIQKNSKPESLPSNVDFDFIAKMCFRRTTLLNSSNPPSVSENVSSFELKTLRLEVECLKENLLRSQQMCKVMERQNFFLIEGDHLRNLAGEERSKGGSKLDSETSRCEGPRISEEDNNSQMLKYKLQNKSENVMTDVEMSELRLRVEELETNLLASQEMVKNLQEKKEKPKDNLKLGEDFKNKDEDGNLKVEDHGKELNSVDEAKDERINLINKERECFESAVNEFESNHNLGKPAIDEDIKKIDSESDIVGNVESLESQLRQKVEDQEREILILKESINSFKIEIETLASLCSQTKAKSGEYEIKIEELNSTNEKLSLKELEYKCLKEEVLEMKETLLKVKVTLDEKGRRVATLEAEASESASVGLKLKESLEELKRSQMEMSFQKLENEKLMETLNGFEKEKRKNSKVTKELSQSNEGLQRDLQTSTQILEKWKKNSENLETEIDSLKKILGERESSNINLAASFDRLLKVKESLSADKQNLESSIESLKLENTELRVSVADLSETINKMKMERALREDDFNAMQAKMEEAVKTKEVHEMEENLREKEQLSKDLNANQMSEKIQNLKEAIQILTDEKKIALEEYEERVSMKDRILARCYDNLSNAQQLLGDAALKVTSLESKVQELTPMSSDDKDSLISSLKLELNVLKEHSVASLGTESETSLGHPDSSVIVNRANEFKINPIEDSSDEQLMDLLQQVDALKLSLALKDEELEKIRCDHEDLVQRYEEMSLIKKHVFYNDKSSIEEMSEDKTISTQFGKGFPVTSDNLSKTEVTTSEPGRLKKFQENVENFELVMATEERSTSNYVEEKITKTVVNTQQNETTKVDTSDETSDIFPDRESLLAKLEQVKQSLEENQQELASMRQRESQFGFPRSGSKSRSPFSPREHFDSLDLSHDIFLTPEKSYGQGTEKCQGDYSFSCVDDHHQNLVDLSPTKKEIVSGHGVESSNEKSDSDILDLSEVKGQSLGNLHPAKELDYDELHERHYLLTKEVERLNTELHFYYANSHLKHHHQHKEENDKHDSFLDLTEPTELEYLRNVLYKYMLGTETKTLARVICTVVRFSDVQTRKILETEESKNSFFRAKTIKEETH